jgi:hypothetical protein
MEKIKIKIVNIKLRSMTSILFFPFDECFVCLLHECGVAAERGSLGMMRERAAGTAPELTNSYVRHTRQTQNKSSFASFPFSGSR